MRRGGEDDGGAAAEAPQLLGLRGLRSIVERATSEQLVIPNGVPRFFFPAAVWRARDAERDLLFAEAGSESL